MDLNSLYDLLAEPKRTMADGTLRLPSWDDIALAAHVDPVNDTYAFRALVEKGAITRKIVPNTFGDVDYRVVRVQPERMPAFRQTLRTIGAVWYG